MNKYLIASLTIAILLSLFSPFSSANITLERTRIVMAAPKMEASIVVTNAESEPVMLQAWIEPINATATPDVPFAITPTLLSPSRAVRIEFESINDAGILVQHSRNKYYLRIKKLNTL
ncbi:hypothetical protein PflCFBP13517_23040 [Pseudomonas fluorescens]|nr:hypothetical protein PflCFBP13517_23040 [Pseudomonas fluorescens]